MPSNQSKVDQLLAALPEMRMPQFAVPTIDLPKLVQPPLPAASMYERLKKNTAFEEGLDNEHEIGARVVSFGAETLYIDGLGYHGNDLVIFFGAMADGSPVRLLQHISQTNLLLVALKKRGPEPKRLGFKVANGGEEPASAAK